MVEFDFNTENIKNLESVINKQISKFNTIREFVKNLEFTVVEPVGEYDKLTYTAIDGGKMGIHLDPFEIEFIEVADSKDNVLISTVIPRGDSLSISDIDNLKNDIIAIKTLLDIVRKDKLTDISYEKILEDPSKLMEILEYAFIFWKLKTFDSTEPLLIIRDGLLRTKAINKDYIQGGELLNFLSKVKENRHYLVGVAKTSKLLNLINTALAVENKFPPGRTGYIEIPLELEMMAYKWTGKGKIKENSKNYLHYAFGKLYIAKLAPNSNLLVTVEIPYDLKNNKEIYSRETIYEIFGNLIRDSLYSYPIIGYPQTIMRAHETAVNIGFSASVWRDKIMDAIKDKITDEKIREYLDKLIVSAEKVKKGRLGGI